MIFTNYKSHPVINSEVTFEDIFLFTVVVATKFEATSLGGETAGCVVAAGFPWQRLTEHRWWQPVFGIPADSKVSGNVTPVDDCSGNESKSLKINFNQFTNLPGLVHLFKTNEI